jgi:hypothetical protein
MCPLLYSAIQQKVVVEDIKMKRKYYPIFDYRSCHIKISFGAPLEEIWKRHAKFSVLFQKISGLILARE